MTLLLETQCSLYKRSFNLLWAGNTLLQTIFGISSRAYKIRVARLQAFKDFDFSSRQYSETSDDNRSLSPSLPHNNLTENIIDGHVVKREFSLYRRNLRSASFGVGL